MKRLTVAVPFPVVGAVGLVRMWGPVCLDHPRDTDRPTDYSRESAEAFAHALQCAHDDHKGVTMQRKIDYPTGDPNGMSFICNKWVHTGPQGYRVQFTGTGEDRGDWSVFSYAGSHTRLVYGGRDLSEDAAHEMAARLARTTPHPRPTEV